MLAPNTILQNRYRVVRKLGQGGMGAVYEAIDQRVSCVVALKETLVRSDAEARRAFKREAGLLASLRHHSLPKVMDYFSEGQGEFLVMEYIPGYDLAELLELRGSPFPQDQVVRWANQLLSVLEYLHSSRPPILHRDIKPSNLKLTKQGEVFLLDFGLAKGAAGQMSTLRTSKSLRGFTSGFAPLEQILGQGTDPRSDLYGLAATLYHLLTNVPPTDAPTRFAAMEDGEDDALPLIESLNPQVSPRITKIIHQALAMSRRQRPASAADMEQALRLALEEDERLAAEEEYLRAEAKRQQHEEEKRHKAEEDRRLQEAETRRREQARLQSEAEQREEDAARRAAEKEHQSEVEAERKRAKVPETIPAPSPIIKTQDPTSISSVEQAPSQPAIKTLKSPPPERLFASSSALASSAKSPAAPASVLARSKRAIAITIAALGLVSVILIPVLKRTWPLGDSKLPGGTQLPAASEDSKPTPQPSPPQGMVYVPGVKFMMGRDDGDEYERPAHQVTVKPFFIDVYEVTNEDYARFIKETKHRPPSTWPGGTYRAGAAHKPVTGVTWDDANDYAKWAHKRLPTEEEWEFAARGTDGRRYPWGNEWKQGLANANNPGNGQIANVGTFKGTSPYGAFDMSGNVWEWTSTKMGPYPGGTLPKRIIVSDEMKVIRGGTYQSTSNQVTTTFRRGYPTPGDDDYSIMGFRCVRDAP